ncbi:ABC transporter ATP-binding protein [Nonomuraea sp. NPDC050663]|uniref:ABC transporter ATP-binding protein n=1 Tax=Nonomuraea sp. NPDC050663 TaxID=3364370 RepID=UPI003799B679
MAAFLLVTLAEAAAPVVAAWMLKLTLDTLAAGGDILWPALGMAATGLATATAPQLTRYLSAELGRRVGLRALDRLFTALDRFVGLAPFEDPAFLDRLRLAQQGASTSGQFVSGAFGMARAAVTLAGFLAALLVISPLLALVVAVAAVPALWAELTLSRGRAAMLWRITPNQRKEIFYSQLLGSVEAAKEIRLFGLGPFLRGRMLGERDRANAGQRAMDRKELAAQGGLGLLGALAAGTGLVWAVLAARRGELTVGDVSLLLAAVASTQVAASTLVRSAADTHQQLIIFGHHTAVVTAEPDLPLPGAPAAVPAGGQGIELRDVWFRYSDEHPWVLRGVNLTIPTGRAVALVGLNGAGKSTLVKLLCRLYDPTRGTILWNGVDVRELDPAELRGRISAVFQDHMGYDFSASDNIAVGDLTAHGDPARIGSAAQRAGVHDQLMALPQGYDTPLTRTFADGTGAGVMLSGGQWQRVALARAILRGDRDLMILDEPSSGLDPQAEHDVHERMLRYRAGRTSLLISHRLNAVRHADTIAVLDEGVIVESGHHDELMEAGGGYARLFHLQAQGYRDELVTP